MAGPSGHAKLSPSAAHRWLTCPASVAACANVVSPDTEHSKNGTAGHWVYAEWLINGEPPPVGAAAPNGVVITQELIDLAAVGVGWVRQYIAERPCTLLVEEPTEIGTMFGLEPGICWGTSDTFILASHGELVVADLKLGYMNVEVEDNEQLMLYAGGLIQAVGALFDTVRFVIIQPRQGGVKEWTLSMADLQGRLEKMGPGVAAALQPDAPYKPSESGCKFCSAAGVCKALQGEALALAKREFDTPVGIVDNITIEELSLLLEKAPVIEAALDAVRAHAKKLLACGVDVPGWKRVEGRKDRVWKEGVEAQVDETLCNLGFGADDIRPRKLVSPAQAEKLAGKKAVENFITKPKGEPVLAPASDKRPALPADFTALDSGIDEMLD